MKTYFWILIFSFTSFAVENLYSQYTTTWAQVQPLLVALQKRTGFSSTIWMLRVLLGVGLTLQYEYGL